jgi:hypothetical protein
MGEGEGYGSWRETIEIALTLLDIDLTLTTGPPMEPTKPVIREGKAPDAFATCQ